MAELLTALGVMSGTSMDGVDIALLTTDGEETAERGPFFSQPYPAAIRARIADALNEAREIKERTERPASLAILEGQLTAIHGEAIRNYLSRMGIEPSSIDVIGYHGHTVLHRPEQRLTVQLGDGAMLARLTGRAVVNDLRAADVQAGGEGAPLAPVYPGPGCAGSRTAGGVRQYRRRRQCHLGRPRRGAARLRLWAGQCADG